MERRSAENEKRYLKHELQHLGAKVWQMRRDVQSLAREPPGRSALLAQIKPLKAGAAFDRFARYADAMLDENEFFIRTAIGWVLAGQRRRAPTTSTSG